MSATDDLAGSHEVQWRTRLSMWLLTRLPNEEKETAMDMLVAGLSQARDEGIGDAIEIVERVTVHASESQRRVLGIITEALSKLRAINNLNAD